MIFAEKKAPDMPDVPWDAFNGGDEEAVSSTLDKMVALGYDGYIRGCRVRLESRIEGLAGPKGPRWDGSGPGKGGAGPRADGTGRSERMKACLKRFHAANTSKKFTDGLPENRKAILRKFVISDMPALLRYAETLEKRNADTSS